MQMKTRIFGIIFIVAGIIMLIYSGLTYSTTEKVVCLGTLNLNIQRTHTIHWTPIIAGAVLLFGVVIVVLDRKNLI